MSSEPRPPPYLRLAVGVGLALLVWVLLPAVPHDQKVIFSLGSCARRIAELQVSWRESSKRHAGGVKLGFPDGAPRRVVRSFRLVDGEYDFVVSARRRAHETTTAAATEPGNKAEPRRTEATRRATLEGTTVTLRLEDLCPLAHPPLQTSPPAL